MKSIITILTILFTTSLLSAQCDNQDPITVDNSGLENWDEETFYDNPSGDFWDTANRTLDLVLGTIPASVERTSDAHSGNYAAKIITRTWFGQLASGTLFAGFFDSSVVLTDPDNSVKFGKPFTERPDEFSYWYKYEPVQGDSAEAYSYLTRWNGSSRDTIASAYTKIYDAKNVYTLAEIPFVYNNNFTEDPDSITIVFASSSRGDIFQGQEGNTLFVDDISLYYCVTSSYQPLMSENNVTVYPNPTTTELVNFSLEKPIENGLVRVYTNDGKNVSLSSFQGDSHQINVGNWTQGVYRYSIIDQESSLTLSSGSFTVTK